MLHSNLDSTADVAKALREGIESHVRYTLVRRPSDHLTPAELLVPVSLAVRDLFVDRMLATSNRYRTADAKHLYYLSMEFLMGRLLGDTVCNLRLNETLDGVLAEFGVRLEQVLESEADAGLGNGGLGRLAACFLESLATLEMPGYGYGIDYEYGMFRQEIANGFQREKPDRWKGNGTPFQIQRPEEARWSSEYRTTCRWSAITATPSIVCVSFRRARQKTSISTSSTVATTFAPSSRKSAARTSPACSIPATR
jgi:starch phosphorylase